MMGRTTILIWIRKRLADEALQCHGKIK
jgi:hypothetical protein